MYRQDVLNDIAGINRSFKNAPPYLVALLLTSKYKGSVWQKGKEIVSLIDGWYYDVTGVVILSNLQLKKWEEVTTLGGKDLELFKQIKKVL